MTSTSQVIRLLYIFTAFENVTQRATAHCYKNCSSKTVQHFLITTFHDSLNCKVTYFVSLLIENWIQPLEIDAKIVKV